MLFTPELLLKCSCFKASTGNRITRIKLLGGDGISVCWRREPTTEETLEFENWFQAQVPDPLDITGYDSGTSGPRQRQREKEAYDNWRKKVIKGGQ